MASKTKRSSKKSSGKGNWLEYVKPIIETINTIMNTAAEFFTKRIASTIKEELDNLIDHAETRLETITQRTINQITISLILFIAFILFIISGMFALAEYANMSNTFIFMIAGAVMLGIGFWLRYNSMKQYSTKKQKEVS